MSKFKSEDEIVEEMLTAIRADEKALISWEEMERKDLIFHHHGVGQNIRNRFLLWDPENPHTREGNGHVNPKTNIADHPNHADQMSGRIMGRVWDKLHEEAEARNG